MQVWRLQTRTRGGDIADICLKENVVAMGWALNESDEAELSKSPNIRLYYDMAEANPKMKNYSSVWRMAVDTQVNDIVWMRHRGQYYFARVSENSQWVYDFSKEAHDTDTTNRLSNMIWHTVSDKSDEASVPGCLTTGFIKGSTFQRINKSGINEYSQMLYNMRASETDGYRYDNPKLSLNERHFWNLLQPDDAEDLLCMWLYAEKGYVVIPSTNKKGTQLYECILIDPHSIDYRHIYIQVKKGDITINAFQYDKLGGEVYFLSTEGKVINACNQNHHVVDSTKVYEFAIDQKNAPIIPEKITYWIRFLAESENENMDKTKAKGIMLDTNRSYSDTNERDMLTQSRVCAYGDADRYINSYRKGDFALFYAKGKGIIAIGEVISDTPKKVETEKGLYHDVRMIVPDNGDYSKINDKFISAREIKEILNRGFYFASTIKTPFLDSSQVEKLIFALKEKYK